STPTSSSADVAAASRAFADLEPARGARSAARGLPGLCEARRLRAVGVHVARDAGIRDVEHARAPRAHRRCLAVLAPQAILRPSAAVARSIAALRAGTTHRRVVATRLLTGADRGAATEAVERLLAGPLDASRARRTARYVGPAAFPELADVAHR